MKYLTSGLQRSMYCLIRFSGEQSHQEYIAAWTESMSCVDECSKNEADFQAEYAEHVKQKFHPSIYKAEDVAKVVFNEDGTVKELDENIYNVLNRIGNEVRALVEERFKQRNQIYQTILDGYYPNAVKALVLCNKHDYRIRKVSIEMPHLFLEFEYDIILACRFCLAIGGTCEDLSVYVDYTVLAEEVFPNEDGTFTYNLLLWSWDKVLETDDLRRISIETDDLREISIVFSEVEIIETPKEQGEV